MIQAFAGFYIGYFLVMLATTIAGCILAKSNIGLILFGAGVIAQFVIILSIYKKVAALSTYTVALMWPTYVAILLMGGFVIIARRVV